MEIVDFNNFKDDEEQKIIGNDLRDITILFLERGVRVISPEGKVVDEMNYKSNEVFQFEKETVFKKNSSISFIGTSGGEYMLEIGHDGTILSDWILVDAEGGAINTRPSKGSDFVLGISPSENYMVVPILHTRNNGVSYRVTAELKVYNEKLEFVRSEPISQFVELMAPWACDISDEGSILIADEGGLLYLGDSEWKKLSVDDLGWGKVASKSWQYPISWGFTSKGIFSMTFLGSEGKKDPVKMYNASWDPKNGLSELVKVPLDKDNPISAPGKAEGFQLYHYSNVSGYDFFAVKCFDGAIILGAIMDGDILWSSAEKLRADLSPEDMRVAMFPLEDQMVLMVGSDKKLKESEDVKNYSLFALFNRDRDGMLMTEQVKHSSKTHRVCGRIVYTPISRSVVKVRSICMNTETEILFRVN